MKNTFIAVLLAVVAAQAAETKIWYDKPAQRWEKQALPIGNGRVGAMVFGKTEIERIQFNEDSLWTGDEKDTGFYQAFGDLFIDIDGDGEVSNYRRELDIERAVHTVSYTKDGVNYRREYFASHPAGVMVFRFSADKPGAYTGQVLLTDMHGAEMQTDGKRFIATGSLKNGLQYESQALFIHEGGTSRAVFGQHYFQRVDSFTIYLDAGTDYLNKREKKWRGEHPHKAITERLAKAAATPYTELLAAHLRDYQSLFNRVFIDTGKSSAKLSALPTDRRLIAYRGTEKLNADKDPFNNGVIDDPNIKGSEDPGLEALFFQYARYLMISCSRPGDLPANLQGLWNNSNRPPWRGDYHSDVNVQMNYWFVDAANISECFQPYPEWLNAHIPVRREATKAHYGTRGWATRSENGIFGGATYFWVPGDAAWLLQNIWDHYAFTRDRQYLDTRAYPMIKELCEFWEDFLKERADGKLVSPQSVSPEHGEPAEGNSYEQQLVYDLFTNFIEASKDCGVDAEYRTKVEQMRSRLLGPRIGSWGQLQEWAEDIDKPNDRHRHISHTLAVFPGRQISPLTTAELAEAAKRSMNARGDAGVGWCRAQRACVWARLHDGDRAYKILKGLLRYQVTPNLLNRNPPFQIDGNFGSAAAVCEMLLQSHMGEIHLLPALPKAWAKGKVTGLKARGNFTVDIEWRDGKVTQYRIASPESREVKVRVDGETKIIRSEKL
jgi:alpha-L-fucosidase 2